MHMNELSRWKRVLFLFLYFAVYLIGWQLWLSGIVYDQSGRRAYYFGYLLIYVLMILIFYLVGMRWYQSEWQQLKKKQESPAVTSLYTVAALFCTVFVLNLILFGFFHADVPDNQANNLTYMSADPFGFLVSSLVFAPFIEETVFRGCIFAPLRQKHSFVFSALLSGFLFGFLHVLASVMSRDYGQCIYLLVYALCGFVLAIPYERTGSIFSGMFTHMLYNLLGIVFMLF